MNIFFYRQYKELYKTISRLRKEVEMEKEINEKLREKVVALENTLAVISNKIKNLEKK